MSTGIKLKLRLGGQTFSPKPAGQPVGSKVPPPPLSAVSGSTAPAAPEHVQRKEKKKKKRHRDEAGGPAHPPGNSAAMRTGNATGPSSGAQPAAVPGQHAPAPIRLTLKSFPRPAGASAAQPPQQQHGGATDQPRPKKKRKKERDGAAGDGRLGGSAPSRQHAPLPKLRLKSGSGGWDQQLAQAAAAAAVTAAEQGRPGPVSFRVPSISGGLGGQGGTGGVQKLKKKKEQKPQGSAAPEVRKPPARVRRASARSESRDDEADGYEAATPDPLRRLGQGFAPPPKGAPGARPAGSAARAASSQDQAVSSHAEPEAVSAPPPGPEIPPTPADIERVMAKVQKRDVFHIFKEPVTDAMAPGYSAAIKRPMDFTTMRQRHAEGAYTEWDSLQEDMRTMFSNAMSFNPPETLYHKQAKTILGVADKLIALGRRGIKDTRGRAPSILRAPAAPPAAEQKAEADKPRAPEKAEKPAVQPKKLAQRAVSSAARLSSGGYAKGAAGRQVAPVQPPPEVDETVRNHYPKRPSLTDAGVATMKGLACGASAEGTPFGRLALAPLRGANSGNSYAKHFHHFIRNLSSKAKALAEVYLRHSSEPRLPPAAIQPQPVQQQPVQQQFRPPSAPAQQAQQPQQLQQQPVPQQFRPPSVPLQQPQQPQQQLRSANSPMQQQQPVQQQLRPAAWAVQPQQKQQQQQPQPQQQQQQQLPVPGSFIAARSLNPQLAPSLAAALTPPGTPPTSAAASAPLQSSLQAAATTTPHAGSQQATGALGSGVPTNAQPAHAPHPV